MRKFLTNRINGEPIPHGFKWQAIQTECCKYPTSIITVDAYSELREISLQMIRWFKGVLLPALATSTGDSVAYWETKIKLIVDPDYFKPFSIILDGIAFNCVPSIANMPMQRAINLVEGSVDHLRNAPEYDGHFSWVTLPDSSLRTT